jgi:hypothetical protein
LYLPSGLRTDTAADRLKSLVSRSLAVEAGYLDGPRFEKAVDAFLDCRRSWSTPLWMALSLEAWLRSGVLHST